jgi:hypothetical protein
MRVYHPSTIYYLAIALGPFDKHERERNELYPITSSVKLSTLVKWTNMCMYTELSYDLYYLEKNKKKEISVLWLT